VRSFPFQETDSLPTGVRRLIDKCTFLQGPVRSSFVQLFQLVLGLQVDPSGNAQVNCFSPESLRVVLLGVIAFVAKNYGNACLIVSRSTKWPKTFLDSLSYGQREGGIMTAFLHRV